MNRLVLAAAVIAAASPLPAQGRLAVAADTVLPLAFGQTFTLASGVLGERRRINIYLPTGYAESDTTRFAVLYMPDGGLAEDFLHVAGLVQVSVGNGTMRPFIVVGVENTERRRDMTGPTTVESDKRIAPRVGGSAAFRAFFKTELIPLITTKYRTTRETAIVGESLAGLFVVETLLADPGLFDTYIALDPSLWWNGGKLAREARQRLEAISVTGKTVFLAGSGDAGLDDQLRSLTRDLQAQAGRGLRAIYEPMPAETHATIYHPAALRAFRTVFRPGKP